MAVFLEEEEAQDAELVLFSDLRASLEFDFVSVVQTSSLSPKSSAPVSRFSGYRKL